MTRSETDLIEESERCLGYAAEGGNSVDHWISRSIALSALAIAKALQPTVQIIETPLRFKNGEQIT